MCKNNKVRCNIILWSTSSVLKNHENMFIMSYDDHKIFNLVKWKFIDTCNHDVEVVTTNMLVNLVNTQLIESFWKCFHLEKSNVQLCSWVLFLTLGMWTHAISTQILWLSISPMSFLVQFGDIRLKHFKNPNLINYCAVIYHSTRWIFMQIINLAGKWQLIFLFSFLRFNFNFLLELSPLGLFFGS